LRFLGYERGVKKRGAIADVTSPLARRLLAIVAILSIAVTGVATAVTFVFVQRAAADAQIRHLAEYAAERVKTEDRLFSDLVKVHEAASDSLARRLATIDPATVDGEFDALFPKFGDGTRRTPDALYDGGMVAGDYTYGIGGYLRDADKMTRQEKALFVAAVQAVSHTGEAELNRYDNFYFFTPDTRLVMFGPRRADRLTYYRQKAPPTFDTSGEEMNLLTLPRQNPQRVMKCTKLRKVLSDPSGRGLNSACMTPFDYHGRQMGAWGTSLSLDSYLLRAVEDSLPGGRNMIVSSDGELIAAPGLAKNGVVDAQALVRAQADEQVADVVRQIRALGADTGALRHGDRVIAYGRLKEPDWYFLMSFPSGELVWSAVKTASWVLLFGVLGVIIQVALLYRVMRLTVERPLRVLADAHRTGQVERGRADRGPHRRDRRPGPHPAQPARRQYRAAALAGGAGRRADRRAGARQPGQVDVPGQHVPRAAHAAERGHRHRRPPGGRGRPGAPPRAGSPGHVFGPTARAGAQRHP
jgi:hypothetical protein